MTSPDAAIAGKRHSASTQSAGAADTLHLLVCETRHLVGLLHPEQFEPLTPLTGDATYRWNTRLADHHFTATCGCSTFSNTPAYRWSHWTVITGHGVNARLFDHFALPRAPVVVVDGKHLW
jgi:hypothetical protein